MHRPVGPVEGRGQRQPVEVEVGIAVQQEERLVEPVGRVHQGARGAGRLRLGHDLDRELAEALTVVAPLDLARLVAAQQQSGA